MMPRTSLGGLSAGHRAIIYLLMSLYLALTYLAVGN